MLDLHLALAPVCRYALATLLNLAGGPGGVRDIAHHPTAIHQLTAALDTHPTTLDVQQYGCGVVGQVCEADYAFARQVLASGCLPGVVAAMQTHLKARGVQREGVRALAALAHVDYDVATSAAGKAASPGTTLFLSGALQGVTAALRTHEDRETLLHGLEVLFQLSRTPAHVPSMGTGGALACALASLRSRVVTEVGKQAALATLAQLANAPANAALLMLPTTLELVASTVLDCMDNVDLVTVSMQLLALVSASPGPESKTNLAHANCASAAVAALGPHMDVPALVIAACEVLARVADVAPVRPAVLGPDNGGITSVLRAMRTHPALAPVAMFGAWCLASLSTDAPDVAAAVVLAGGREVLVRAEGDHAAQREVLLEVDRALTALASAAPDGA